MPNPLARYTRNYFVFDLKAGFITSVVALPLAIAFAIASGVAPIVGITTAIIAGILGALFGGSRFSITGPTGAMTVIILGTLNKHGFEGLMLAGLLAGLIQILFGLLKFGRIIKFIPLPVVSGFTAGIGAIIFIGQIANGLGISIPTEEFVGHTLVDIFQSLSELNVVAFSICIGTVLMLRFLPKLFQKFDSLAWIPASLVPLVLSTLAVYMLQLQVPQVGEVPSGLFSFSLLNFNFDLFNAVLPAALTIALLGAIEALLCAVVCDAMTGTRHDSDKELIGQGIANVVLPFFGGMAATAAIARSAVNIREGAKTIGSPIIHSLFLLSYILLLGGVVQYIPKAFLAGILMYVAFRMINIEECRAITRISRQDALVLYLTLFLTLLTDLVFAVQMGMLLAIVLLFLRLVALADVTTMEEYDQDEGLNALVLQKPGLQKYLAIYTLHGPFFFGSMSVFEKKIDEHMHISKPVIILRMKHVPFIDSTGLIRLNDFIRDRRKQGGYVLFSGLTQKVKQTLLADGDFREITPNEYMFERTFEAIGYVETKLLTAKGITPAPKMAKGN